MGILSDDRAQAIQVGAVLLFAILIIFLSLYQAFVVPNQNEEIEFNHNQDLQEQMTELRSAMVSMPETTTTRSVSLDLGVRYPSRAIFVNPGPASGTLETRETTNTSHEIRIRGANATETEPLGVGDFWNGSERTYNTGALSYRPGYNEYNGAPRTVYEHSVLFNHFERNERTLSVTGQALVDDERITLIALNGSMNENRVDRTSVDLRPVSTDTQIVELEPENDELTIELPTTVSEDGWTESLDGLEDNEKIADVDISSEAVTLEIGGEIQLQLAKVGVGTGVTSTEPAYITGVDGDGAEIDEGDTHEFTVEVRDDYNNPKRGVTVNASASAGSVEESKETRRNGEATFEYDSSGVEPGEDDVDFSITEGYEPDETHNSGAPENITITVTVEEESEEGPGATDPRYNIAFNEQSIQTQPGVEYNEDGDAYTVFAEATLDTDITDANTNEPVAFATADYTLMGGGGASVNPSTNDTTVGGETSTVLKRGGFEDENEVQTRIELAQDELDVRYDGVQINFQPPDADVDDDAFDDVDGFESPYRTPPGFINDTGLEKTEQHNLNFGWDENWAEQELYRPIEGNTRDDIADFEEPLINGTFNHWVDSPAEEYDSTVHPSWSIDLPDGFYEVTISGGDSDNADQNVSFRVGDNIEDFTDEEFDDETNTRPENGFVKHTGVVEVTGGELVIQPPDGTYNPKLSWLRIVPSEPPAELDIQDFSNEFPDEEAGHDYGDVTITVSELNDVELEDEEVTLQVVGDEEGEVFSETIDDENIPAGESNDFEFSVGTIDEADNYTATVIADAENAGQVTETTDFEVVEEQDIQPTLDVDSSGIDPNTATEGEEESFTAMVELKNLGEVTEGDVTVTLIDYDDGTDDVEETNVSADLSGDTATIIVDGGDFDNVEAPDTGDYTVEASVDNFNGDVDPIEPTQIDTITVTEEASEAANLNADDVTVNADDAEQSFTATVTDADDIPVEGETVIVNSDDGLTDLDQSVDTDASGEATFEFNENTAGDYNIELELEDDESITESLTVTVDPSEPSSVDVTVNDDTATADGTDELSYTATVTDEFGNTIEGVTVVTSSEDAEDIEFDGDDSLETDANGEVDVTVTSTSAQEDITFTFEEQENNNDATATGTFEAGDVDRVQIDPADDQTITAGDEIDFDATALDEFDNVVEDDDSEFNWDAEDGEIDGEGLFTETDVGDYDVTAEFDGVTSDSTTVTVEESDSSQIQLSGSGTAGGDGQSTISFELENTGNSDIDITDISVDETDTDAEWVERTDGNTFQGANGFFSGRIDIGEGSEALEETATISTEAVEEFDLGSFRDGTGRGGRVNMNNQEATITLTFGDGSSAEYVLDTN